MPREEASCPVVAAKSLLLSRIIDTKENYDVMTLDALSTFTQCSMLESINGEQAMLKICRVLVGMLCKIALEVYEDFVAHDNNNNKILYIDILKLLCRILKALILCS